MKKEKRNEIYALVYDNVLNKKLSKKEWYKVRKTLSKLLKDLCEIPLIKEKIVYVEKKENKKKGYWDM